MLNTKTALDDPGIDAPPIRIGAAEQQSILERQNQLMLEEKVDLPWWAKITTQQRDHFAGTAIARWWDAEASPYPPVVWVPILMIQQPLGVHLLKGTLRQTEFPAIEEAGVHLHPLLVWARYEFDFRFFDAATTDIEPDDLLFVLPKVEHVAGGVLTRAEPIPFENFALVVPPRVAQPRGGGGRSAGEGSGSFCSGTSPGRVSLVDRRRRSSGQCKSPWRGRP